MYRGLFIGASSTDVQKLTYADVSAGEHYIYVKFRKDGSAHSGNDSVQFKVADESLSAIKIITPTRLKLYNSEQDVLADTTQDENMLAMIPGDEKDLAPVYYKFDGTSWTKYELGGPITTEEYNEALNTAKLIYGTEIPYSKLLSYIQSDGSQKINTGVTANNNIKVQVQFEIALNKGNVFAAYNTDDDDMRLIIENSTIYLDYASSRIQQKNYISLNEKYTIETSNYYIKNLDTSEIVAQGSEVTGMFSSDLPIYLLGLSSNDDENFSGKIYYCKIFKDDILVRDYVPVLDLDNKPCLYDKITNQLYYSISGNDFVGGN